MPKKVMHKIKEALTPEFHKTVAHQSAMITILWVSLLFLAFGVMWALVLMYDRILLLEEAIRVLAA